MVDHLSEHPLDELVVVREKSFEPEANWKLLMENFMEYYHLPAVHPELCLVSGVEERTSCLSLSLSLDLSFTNTARNNITTDSRAQGKGMNVGFLTYPMTRGGTPIDPGILPAMPGLTGRNLETAWFHALFPNTFYFLLPDHIFVVILSPEGPKRTCGLIHLLRGLTRNSQYSHSVVSIILATQVRLRSQLFWFIHLSWRTTRSRIWTKSWTQ